MHNDVQQSVGARGFTLIEMLTVLTLMALVATAALPLARVSIQRQKEAELRAALRSVRQAIDRYKQAADEGQIHRSVGDSGYPPSLDSLVQGVRLIRTPDGRHLYLLRRLPRDPFADPALPAQETWALRSSDSPPDSPRSGRDVFDVSSKSLGIALDGSRYRDW